MPIGLAYIGLPAFVSLASRFTSRAGDIRLDGVTLVFAAGLTVAVSLLLGAIMTVTASSWLTAADTSGPGRGATGRRLFRGLIVLHIAVSFALVVGAGLMLRSVLNLQRVDSGYQSRNVLTMRLSADFIRYWTAADRTSLFQNMLQSIQATPGVDAAAISGALPLSESGNVAEDLLETQQPEIDRSGHAVASLQVISPDFFKTVGMKLHEGRELSEDDSAHAPGVAVVNQSLARRYWPHSSAVGRRIRVGRGPWVTIVGVVADARQRLAEPVKDEVFRPLQQAAVVQVRVFVRSAAPLAAREEQVRLAVKRVDARQPVDSFQTFEDTREQSLVPMRLTALLVSVFAVIALAISAVGVGGVVGASVAMRVRAFGLQMALGATRGRLLRSVLSEGAALGASGLLLGFGFAVPLSSGLGNLMFEVDTHDVLTFAVVAGLLLAVTLGACVAPARRAAHVDPNVALRA